jgi:hypothetical protein
MSYEVAAYTLIFGCQEKSDAIAKIFFTFLTPYFECNFLTGQCCLELEDRSVREALKSLNMLEE